MFPDRSRYVGEGGIVVAAKRRKGGKLKKHPRQREQRQSARRVSNEA